MFHPGTPHPYTTLHCPRPRGLLGTPVPLSPSLSASSLGNPPWSSPSRSRFAPHPGCPQPGDVPLAPGTLAQCSWLLCPAGPGAVPHRSTSADSHPQPQESSSCAGTTGAQAAPCAHHQDRTSQGRTVPLRPPGQRHIQLLRAGNKPAAPLPVSSSSLPLGEDRAHGCQGHPHPRVAQGGTRATASRTMGAESPTAPAWPKQVPRGRGSLGAHHTRALPGRGLCVCLCVCTRLPAPIHVGVCIYLCLCVCVCVREYGNGCAWEVYVCVCLCTYGCAGECRCGYLYVCTRVDVHMYACACIPVSVCLYSVGTRVCASVCRCTLVHVSVPTPTHVCVSVHRCKSSMRVCVTDCRCTPIRVSVITPTCVSVHRCTLAHMSVPALARVSVYLPACAHRYACPSLHPHACPCVCPQMHTGVRVRPCIHTRVRVSARSAARPLPARGRCPQPSPSPPSARGRHGGGSWPLGSERPAGRRRRRRRSRGSVGEKAVPKMSWCSGQRCGRRRAVGAAGRGGAGALPGPGAGRGGAVPSPRCRCPPCRCRCRSPPSPCAAGATRVCGWTATGGWCSRPSSGTRCGACPRDWGGVGIRLTAGPGAPRRALGLGSRRAALRAASGGVNGGRGPRPLGVSPPRRTR